MRKNKLLITLGFLLLFPVVAWAGLVDFTSPLWTEKDSGGDITVTTNKMDVSTMEKEEDSCVDYDYGEDHFGNFTHYFEFYFTAHTPTAYGGLWVLSNTSGATRTDLLAADLGLQAFSIRTGSGERQTYFTNTADDSGDFWEHLMLTLLYATIERRTAPGNAIDFKIYDDSGRTNLLVTLAVTYEATAFRHLGMVHSSEVAGGYITYYVQNLDLNEAVGLSIPIAQYHYMHH